MSSPVPGTLLSSAQLNGITIRYADTATCAVDQQRPIVMMLHGWPESWYSFRYQLQAVHAAGFRGIAPDMRGYGGSSSPEDWQVYNTYCLAGDVLALLQHVGQTRCALVAHDNGASLAWKLVLLYPNVFTVFVPMSVAYGGHDSLHLVPKLIKKFGDPAKPESKPQFNYILHHQLPTAHLDYELNPREALWRLWLFQPSLFKECTPPEFKSSELYCGTQGEAVGMWRRIFRPRSLPAWMSQADFDYYVGEFERAGFRGGLNWYKALYSDQDWLITKQLEGRKVIQPTLFLAGTEDTVVMTQGGPAAVKSMLEKHCVNVVPIFFPKVGHWLQAQAPELVNKALINFLQRHKDKFDIRRSNL